MATELVLADARERDLTKLAEYESVGGYTALAKARGMAPQAVIDEVVASELRGRGGAFFPTGRKWAFIPKPDQNPNPHYLVVNADESEPGSFKDNEIMARVPHRFIEGCLITAYAVDSQHVFVYIRGEYTGPYEVLVGALQAGRTPPSSGAVGSCSSGAASRAFPARSRSLLMASRTTRRPTTGRRSRRRRCPAAPTPPAPGRATPSSSGAAARA